MPSPYGLADAMFYLTEVVPAAWKAGGAEFAIADSRDDLMGVVGLKPPDRLGNGEIGYWVAPWARGRGVAGAAVRTLTAWAFTRGVPRIAILANLENIGSQKVAMASGYRAEGVLRGAERRRDGSRQDLVQFARLPGDPGEPIRSSLPFFPAGELTDGVVRLTPLALADAADFFALESDPEVAQYSVRSIAPDLAAAEQRCRSTLSWWLAGQRMELAVRDAATGAFAGHIQLTGVVPDIGQAMVGYSLTGPYRGRGFMTRAVKLLVDWTFEHTPIARIIAGTNPANTASHHVLERAGFTREALLKGLLPGPDGTREDDVQWARVKTG
jgi:RimJ/RimL family protein N-acetyltransferase